MRKVLIVIGAFLLPLTVMAQEIVIAAEYPGNVALGQRFRIVYSVNSTDGRFAPPQFDPSFSVAGPQSSTSHSVQYINGQMSSVSETNIIYYITASQTGTFNIPPAQYSTKKVTVASEQLTIVVSAGATTPADTQSEGGVTAKPEGEVSMKLLLNRDEVFIGQPVTATLKIYTRINLAGLNDLKYPELKGFLREDIKTPELRGLEPEVINGVEYGTGIIQQFVLFPQVAGDITIDPVRITALVQQRSKSADPFFSDPFFNDFFGNVTTVPREIFTAPRVIHVKPLPSPQPSDFFGAVGSFEVETSLDKSDTEVNDALTYTVTLRGSGNLNLAGMPSVSFPHGIEKYDPKTNLRVTSPGSGIKTFEYLLIPRNTGSFDIPPLSYTVFDPSDGKYKTLKAAGFTINVRSGAPGSANIIAPSSAPGEDVKYLGQDIRFIRTDTGGMYRSPLALITTMSYWIWYIILFVLTITTFVIRREYIRRTSDLTGVRNRRAAGVARKRLTKAGSLLKASKPELVSDEIARALWGYLGDKLTIATADLTRDKCYETLRNRSVDEQLISELDSILAACEYSRYSRSSGSESPETLFSRTGDLIRRLENAL